MTLPSRLHAEYLRRFDNLIQVGERVLASCKTERKAIMPPPDQGWDEPEYRNVFSLDERAFYEWRSKCATLLEQVTRRDSAHANWVVIFRDLPQGENCVKSGLSHLRAMMDDFEHGFLDDILNKVEAEIAGDYMGQAEQLLSEGQPGKYDHVPAAVLAGAVLEKSLRTLCDQQQPPIPTIAASGKPKTLDPLITDLKKADVFNEAKAQQLRAWAKIRNHAAHGEFDKFTRSDVELMIKGITDFLGTYLG